MLIIEANVYTSCTNDDKENRYGHVLMSIGYYCMQQYSQIRDEIGGSGGHTLMVRDQHHGSSSGPLRGCAMPPMCPDQCLPQGTVWYINTLPVL